MMSQREMRMMTTGMVTGNRIMTIFRERLPKMKTRRRRMTMMMTPSSLTPTPSPPSIGLGASRPNKTRRSPPL